MSYPNIVYREDPAIRKALEAIAARRGEKLSAVIRKATAQYVKRSV